MKKIYSILGITILVNCLLPTASLFSQTLSPKAISSGGGYATGGGNSLSFTIGETINTTLSAGNNLLSQGQQQPEIEIIATGASAYSACAGSLLDVQYTAAGYYGVANTFTAQISDGSGSFSSPVNIGSIAALTGGLINCIIPAATPAGNNYRIRVVSNFPLYTGKQISSAITIGGSVVAAPASIAGAALGCPGTTGNAYSTPVIAGATNYVWSGTGGISVVGTGTNVTVNFSAGFSSGTLCVHTVSSCGTNSANFCRTISRTTEKPGTISGGSACPNASTIFTIVPVANAVSYNWTCSVIGSVVTPAGTSCTVAFPSTIPAGSTICVTATSGCGFVSTQRCMNLSTGAPAKPTTIDGPSTGQCGGVLVAYSVPPVTGAASYLWTVNGGATISGPNNQSSVLVNFPASFNNITLSASAVNNCGTSQARTLTIKGAVSTPTSITGNTAVCNGMTEIYTAIGSPGATSYIWTKPASATIIGSSTGPSISVLWGASGGNIIAKANNSCSTSGKATLGVAINCRVAEVNHASENVEVFPNPTDGKTTVRFTSAVDEQILLQLTDLTGKLLLNDNMKAIEGLNYHELDLAGYAPGIYMIHLVSENRNDLIKIVVDR